MSLGTDSIWIHMQVNGWPFPQIRSRNKINVSYIDESIKLNSIKRPIFMIWAYFITQKNLTKNEECGTLIS